MLRKLSRRLMVLRTLPATLSFIFLFKMLIFFERVQVGEGQRAGGRERIRSRLCTDSREPDAGLELMNCEIMT